MKQFLVVMLTLAAALTGCQARPVTPERPPRVAFMTDRDGNFELYLMERNGRNVVKLTNEAGVNNGLPHWSKAAQALTYISDQGTGALAIKRIDAGGGHSATLSTSPVPDSTPPIWSPAGDWIAFSGGSANENVEVYVVSANGADVKNLTNHPATDRFATWSPDGQQVLFASDRDNGLAIYAVGLAGGEPTRLTSLDSASAEPAFSSDGAKIAFMSNQDEDVEIYVMDADGSNPTRLTTAEGFDGYPRWSPSAAQLAFLSGRDGNAEIYVMNADGSGHVNLTNSPESQESVQGDFAWSPDGRQILFHTSRDGDVEVYIMDADGSNLTNLTQNPATDFGSVWVR
jgi:TolB protein